MTDPERKAKIRRNVEKMAAAGASPTEMEAYVQYALAQASGQLAPTPKPELRDTTAGGAIEEDDQPNYGGRLVRTVLNAAQGIPGVEAVEAAAGMIGSKFTDDPMSYRESLETLREELGKIPTGRRFAGRVVGSAAVLPFLPASPVKAGAALGAADQLLAADPISTPLDVVIRAGKTSLGAGAGALLGGVGTAATTGTRVLRSPTTAATLEQRIAAREASAAPLYRKALSEGRGVTGTPAVKNLLGKPDIKEIVAELQTKREFASVAADDPKMLDAIYKVLSDRAALAKRQAEAVTPSRPNVGRFTKRDIEAAQEEVMDAVSGGASLPGPMPTYRKAVSDFAEKSKLIEAAERGHDAVRSRLNRGLPAAKSLKKTSPESFSKYTRKATPDQLKAAVGGILGGTRAAFGQSVRKSGQRALREAPSLLRKAKDPTQVWLDDLIRSGLLTGSAATP